MRASLGVAVALLATLHLAATPVSAQSLGDRLKQKAKDAAEKLDKKGEDKVDEQLDKGVDKLGECLFSDLTCIKKARAEGKTVELKDESGNSVDAKGKPVEKAGVPASAAPASEAPVQPPAAAFANFDFVPGNKVLFADDLSRDRVGNFPQRLELVAGNLEIVEWQGARWVRAVAEGSRFDIPLPQALPQRFTLEFDIAMKEDRGIYQSVHAASAKEAGDAFTSLDGGQVADDLPTTALFISQNEAGIGGGGSPTAKKRYEGANGANDRDADGRIFRVRLQADGRYVKMYVNQDRVANVPNANFGRTNKLRFSLNASTELPVYVGNFTVAAGGSQLYDALLANGRVATQGIFFDTGRDVIKPESGATLRLIGDMLKEHAELKLMIEGHTDNVGSAASNKSLSDRRAAAVRAYLTANFGIDAGRLTSSGLGDTKPAAPNTTPEGRQQNRRVELVKV